MKIIDEPFVAAIYASWDTEATDADRILMLPRLDQAELDQLLQLVQPVWDGNLCSKTARNSLCGKGLAKTWNGLNFLTQAGYCVIDTLGMMGDKTLFVGGFPRKTVSQ